MSRYFLVKIHSPQDTETRLNIHKIDSAEHTDTIISNIRDFYEKEMQCSISTIIQSKIENWDEDEIRGFVMEIFSVFPVVIDDYDIVQFYVDVKGHNEDWKKRFTYDVMEIDDINQRYFVKSERCTIKSPIEYSIELVDQKNKILMGAMEAENDVICEVLKVFISQGSGIIMLAQCFLGHADRFDEADVCLLKEKISFYLKLMLQGLEQAALTELDTPERQHLQEGYDIQAVALEDLGVYPF
eukprot:TRINITY_DN447_c0_g1_i3.p1 TRINITY_DN447_c0_g1~~TRINITY_DN447_c0_g1_i3.p1  ORF type:complete len:242 (+),score=57.35 TRINITY_DN447_c0_g1_i3:43-768(+)